jgi:single-stranded DNA-binding protein
MRYAYISPDTQTNDVRLRGFLTEDASLFVTSPSGKPHLKLRLEVWLDERARRLPPKQPAEVNFINVISSQPEHVTLLAQLQRGREVLVRGLLQSRDVHRPEGGQRRVVIEVAALELIVLPTTRAEVLAASRESRNPHERSLEAYQ